MSTLDPKGTNRLTIATQETRNDRVEWSLAWCKSMARGAQVKAMEGIRRQKSLYQPRVKFCANR